MVIFPPSFFPPIYDAIIEILIFIAIAIHILSAPNDKERLRIIITVIGFFILIFLLPNDFFLVQTLIAAWLVFTGIKMIVSRKVMLALLVIAVVLSFAMPYFFFISFLFYFIVLGGFILSAFINPRGKTIVAAIKEDFKSEGKEIEAATGSAPSGKDLQDTYKDFVDFSTKERQTEKTTLGKIGKGAESFLDSAKKLFKK